MSKKTLEIGLELKQSLLRKFDAEREAMASKEIPFISQKRDAARQIFEEIGFPSTQLETWRKTNLRGVLEREYELEFDPSEINDVSSNSLKCEINRFDTDLYTQLNGKWLDGADGITTYENGTVVGSITSAMIAFPELFEKHYGQYVVNQRNGLIALNSALFNEGYFIHVPDGVEHDKAIQMVNIIDSKRSTLSHNRNLVLLGKNAKLRLVHCDDSMEFQNSFITNVTEINLEDGANLDFYKLQNKDEGAVIMTNTFVKQGKDSNFSSNTIVLNGGLVRNDTHVTLNGRGANADVVGLYLMDKEQFVDNHVYIDHAVANCTSNQLFKGIVDDNARSVFNGHTLVRKDAQQTFAFQSNNNIQLTKTSKIDTHPFLEIYADDVKCSHGATVGQLDMDALFYLMQRGICERNAKMLLMVAFVGQIVNRIKLPNLQASIDELVRKRLKGELNSCEQCSIHCADPDKPIHFEIDMSQI